MNDVYTRYLNSNLNDTNVIRVKNPNQLMTIEQRSLSNTHLDQGSVFKIFYELRQDTVDLIILSHFKQKRFLMHYIQLYIV